MKHKTVRDLDNEIFSYFTPNGSVLAGLILFLGIVAMLTMSGCATTPDEIREASARINAQIDTAQEKISMTIEEKVQVLEAAQEAIRDISENIHALTESVEDSIDEASKE